MDTSAYGPDPRAAARAALRRALADLAESFVRVVRKTELPTREGALAFFGNELLASAISWAAGLVVAGLVRQFFEVKGLRNLWGFAAPSDRTLVSAGVYDGIMWVASFGAGLFMLILVRHLVLRLIAEFHGLRRERARVSPEAGSSAAGRDRGGATPPR